MAGTTNDKLALLRQIKEAFRTAITGKGQTISADEPFSAWPAKVTAIQSGGANITFGNFDFASDSEKDAELGELIVDGSSTLRLYVPFDVTKLKFLAVSVSGDLYNSTSTGNDTECGVFASSGAMMNLDGTNTDYLFTGARSYAHEDDDGDINFYTWDDNDLPFYNASLNCLEFRIASSSAENTIKGAHAELYYWYF